MIPYKIPYNSQINNLMTSCILTEHEKSVLFRFFTKVIYIHICLYISDSPIGGTFMM